MINHPVTSVNRRGLSARSISNGGWLLLIPLLLGMILSACGGGSTANTSHTAATTLKMTPAPSQEEKDLFNPFFTTNNNGSYGAQGFLYETLYIGNQYTGKEIPWLASGSAYSSDLKQLTFTMRSGVKWSDGQDLTSADVKFTFDLMKQYPTLDLPSAWPAIISDVQAPDPNTVVFTLQHVDVTALYRLGGVFIVPQHAWANAGDPTKFTNDTHPVVSGPYLLDSHTPQLIKYKKNPKFWGETNGYPVKVSEIDIPAIANNANAVLSMAKGDLDWLGSGWDPNLDATFTQRDKAHNHTWFAPSNTVMLYLNLQKYPFDQLPVRQAISAAINRDGLQTGPASYAPSANPTGILSPNFKSFIAPTYAAPFKFDATTSVAQAKSTLEAAGWKLGTDGVYADKNGKKLSFSLDVVSGWSDWVQDTSNIAQDLINVGIQATINTMGGYTPYITALRSGDFDAAVSWTDGGPSPYYPYFDMLSSTYSAKVGESSSSGSNFERWSDPATDALLKQYSSTQDATQQQQAIQGLEKIMVEQMPAIPLTYNPYWDEYSTKNFTGWPDATNSYDVGAPYTTPDNEFVILHLTPA